MINLIVANSENNVIGKDNKLIWKQREDMSGLGPISDFKQKLLLKKADG